MNTSTFIWMLFMVLGAQGQDMCEIFTADGCFWTEVHSDSNVDFASATAMCSKNGGTPAHILTEDAYYDLQENIRSKMPLKWGAIYVWLGTTIDPLTGQTDHPFPEEFEEWGLSDPELGRTYRSYTHTFMLVDEDPDDEYQGIGNNPPSWHHHGVVCQA